MQEEALTGRIKALTAFRALFVTLLLGSSFLFKVQYLYVDPRAISLFIISLYLLTIAYSLLINRIKNLFAFIYLQLVVDVLAEIVLIYISGGIDSWYSFTLILTVLSSSIILNKKAGFVIASIGGILYGALLDLQFYKMLPISFEASASEKEYFYNIFIHIISLYLTAFLSGYLSQRLEKTVQKLEEKDHSLKDLEFFNTKVIESLPSGLFTTDMDGKTVVFNQAAEKISGVGRGLVINRKIEAALPFLKFPFKENRREEILNPGAADRKIIGITLSVLRDVSGKETGYIGVFQDLTQLKKLEGEIKRKERLAEIGELASNIAHEIRNPLASMRGSIEMLREDKVPSKHRDQLMGIALREMERLNDIITDFLTYSSPKLIEKQRVDVHLLLEETLALLDNREQEQGKISINKDFDGQLLVQADAQKMKQVFWNLGINAIEAMKDGGHLSVSTEVTADRIRILFSDSGAGINREQIDKIFFPFFTTKDEGTGLGLSIAYRIVEEHGGTMRVQSSPGIKTTFEIILNR